MRRIGISVGHVGPDEEGASHNEIGVTEEQTCRRVLHVLKSMLDEYRDVEAVYAPVDLNLSHRIEFLNGHHAEAGIDISLELHLNAFTDRSVDGCECLYFPTSMTGKAWADKLQGELVQMLTAKDRGSKAFDNRERNAFVRQTTMPSVIIEPFFITNDDRAKQSVVGDAVQRIPAPLPRLDLQPQHHVGERHQKDDTEPVQEKAEGDGVQ